MKRTKLALVLLAILALLIAGCGKGTRPASSTVPVSQVGFERSAPGHPAGCVAPNCQSVTGFRSLSAAGQIVAEQHYQYVTGSPGSAEAARDVALTAGIGWTPSVDTTPGSLTRACTTCGSATSSQQTLANVQWLSTTHDTVANRTIVTAQNARDTSKRLVLSFYGQDPPESVSWVNTLTASNGVAQGSLSIPRNSSAVTYTFALGAACSTSWTWVPYP